MATGVGSVSRSEFLPLLLLRVLRLEIEDAVSSSGVGSVDSVTLFVLLRVDRLPNDKPVCRPLLTVVVASDSL